VSHSLSRDPIHTTAILQQGIIDLVMVIRACLPHTILVGTMPLINGGWAAVVTQGGMQLRQAAGRTPDDAIALLYDMLLDDARKMRAALERVVTQLEKDADERSGKNVVTVTSEPVPDKSSKSPKRKPEVVVEAEIEDD
jgi:hypothetical protein